MYNQKIFPHFKKLRNTWCLKWGNNRLLEAGMYNIGTLYLHCLWAFVWLLGQHMISGSMTKLHERIPLTEQNSETSPRSSPLLRNSCFHLFWTSDDTPTEGVPNHLLCPLSSNPINLFHSPCYDLGHAICVFKFHFLYHKIIIVTGIHLLSFRGWSIKYLSKFNSVSWAFYFTWSHILYSINHIFT